MLGIRSSLAENGFKEMTKFILLAGRRSGTTLLVTSLDSHPQINCTKDVFSTKRRLRYFQVDRPSGLFYRFRSASMKRQIDYIFHRKHLIDAFLAEVYTPPDDSVKAMGSRVSYGQARKYPEIVEWIKENDASVIHLIRQNPLKAIVSHFTAQKRHTYHTTAKVKRVTVQLSPQKLQRAVTKRLREIEMYRQMFKDRRYHEVYYESFVADRNGETRRILDFLGIDQFVPLTSDLVKQNPDSLADILQNYQEVARAFKGSVLEKYLVM
jgi:LPS sulfotransferase NodH